MVRLVFRPYTQLRQSICTSELLRSSIRVSPDFNLARHSSPSFGSQHLCSVYSQQSEVDWKSRECALRILPRADKLLFAFTTPLSLVNSMARIHVRLLGPCFKTGRRDPDILGREMETATEHCSLYESPQIPVWCGARTSRATN